MYTSIASSTNYYSVIVVNFTIEFIELDEVLIRGCEQFKKTKGGAIYNGASTATDLFCYT